MIDLDQTWLRLPRCRAVELFTTKRSRRAKRLEWHSAGSPLSGRGDRGGQQKRVPEPYHEQVFAFIYDGGTDATHVRALE